MEVVLDEGSRINPNGDSREEERVAKIASNLDDVIALNCESPKAEKVCRICHFGSEGSSGPGSELGPLGCDCKGELGFSHHNCAEAWFSQKGNRVCEICGKTARNLIASSYVKEYEDASIVFMMEWNEMRMAAAILDGYDESSRRHHCKKSYCIILFACLVLVFVLPWFFRRMSG